jgi:glycosyltransferase involved in cell wall biosynthesis
MLVETGHIDPPLSILLVSPEYPPMPGGVGRYTSHLKKNLVEMGFTVQVICDKRGNGEFSGIGQHNPKNSEILLEMVERINPDLVHIQYEPGLYGLRLDMLNPARTCTNIDEFYESCKVPIVTTFHSAYPFRQWMSLPIPICERQNDTYMVRKAKRMISFWTRLINYYSFHDLNKEKLTKSAAGITFSEFMSRMLGDQKCNVIFHGAEKQVYTLNRSKADLRKSYSIPVYGRTALALGYATATKGWDVIEKMEIPDGWTIVINASKNEYSHEDFPLSESKKNLINLHRDFLNEKQLCELFSCADAVILPYKVSSGSGIMFDALSYGLPFIATRLGFFVEFASHGLGIAVDRNPKEFSNAMMHLDKNYDKYDDKINEFSMKLSWEQIAKEHAELYYKVVKRKKEQAVIV